MQPRVLTVFPSLGRGGAEMGQLELLAATADRFEHLAVALEGGPLAEELRRAGIALVMLPGHGPLSWPMRVVRLAWLMRSFRPQLVVGLMYRGALAASLAGRLARRPPELWSLHASPDSAVAIRPAGRLVMAACRRLSRGVAAIHYVGRSIAVSHERAGFRAGCVAIIGNGCDVQRFAPDPGARHRLRAEWGVADDELIACHVARVHPDKDHAALQAALSHAFERQPRLRAVLVGPGTAELELRPEIRARTLVLGWRSDVPAVVSACDIGVLSSRSEASPRVLLEYMACELPVATTDAGDAAVVVGDHGRVVPVGDAVALGRAIAELAALDDSRRSVIGRAARQSVVAGHSLEAVVERHVALWSELIAGSQGG
jgi:glycosyltransferase involved in cell wall biosynthesis